MEKKNLKASSASAKSSSDSQTKTSSSDVPKSNKKKTKKTDFELAVHEFIDHCAKMKTPGINETQTRALANLKKYSTCLDLCNEEGIVEDGHVPLYVDLVRNLLELEEDNEDVLHSDKWIKSDNYKLVYVNTKGKKLPDISIHLSDLYTLCTNDEEKGLFLSLLYRILQHAAETRKISNHFRDLSMQFEEDEDKSEDDGSGLDEALDQFQSMVLNKGALQKIFSRIMGVAEKMDNEQTREIITSITSPDQPLTLEKVKETVDRAVNLIPDKEEKKSSKGAKKE